MIQKKQIERLKKLLCNYMKRHPECQTEAKDLMQCLEKENISDSDLMKLYSDYGRLIERLMQEYKNTSQQERGSVYDVYSDYPPDVKRRLKLAESEMHYKNWADAVKALPKKTKPLSAINKSFIENARHKWRESIYGHEDVLQIMLRHIVEYGKAGKTSPILLLGPPGIGKTLIAKNYGMIMNLPLSFISGPSASVNRGLAGAPNLFSGAGAGAIAQAMITNKIGNPIICIDEIEKAVGKYSGSPGFQDELLAAMDDSNTRWHDNFIEMDLDASHIPYVFTANSKESLSGPLLDRMEIVEMKPSSKEDIFHIVKDMTVPKALKTYGPEQIVFEGNEIELLVEVLWKKGNVSCRPYQKAVELLVSDACLSAIETGKTAKITEQNVKSAIESNTMDKAVRAIGFAI